LGLPIPIEPHKGTGVVERFHITEPKGSTFVRHRSMSRRLVPACVEEYLCTMFRFTDKKDRVGVGVYDVILKYDRGGYLLTMGRKQEPLYKKFRGVTDLLYYHRSTERNDQKKK